MTFLLPTIGFFEAAPLEKMSKNVDISLSQAVSTTLPQIALFSDFRAQCVVVYTTIRKRLLGLSNYKGKPQECAPLSRTKVKLDGDLVSRIFDVVTFDSKLTKGLIYNC